MLIRVRNLPEGSGPGATVTVAKAEHPAEPSGSAAGPEAVADTEGGVWEVAVATRLREVNTGKSAGIMNSAAAGAARDTSTATPGRATAEATTASKEETAKTGSGSPIGGMATVAATAEADMVAAMAAMVADRLPAMAAAPEAPVAGVDVADVAAAIEQHGPMCPPNRMQDCANYILISH
jgi:hypothetical protein